MTSQLIPDHCGGYRSCGSRDPQEAVAAIQTRDGGAGVCGGDGKTPGTEDGTARPWCWDVAHGIRASWVGSSDADPRDVLRHLHVQARGARGTDLAYDDTWKHSDGHLHQDWTGREHVPGRELREGPERWEGKQAGECSVLEAREGRECGEQGGSQSQALLQGQD